MRGAEAGLVVVAGLVGLASAPLAASLPPAPAPLVLTAAEQAEVAAGQIVVRLAAPDNGFTTIGVVDVEASPEVVLDAVVDVRARVAEISLVKRIDLYVDEVDATGRGTLGARWDTGTVGLSRVFHIRYDFDRALGWCVYALDETQQNDIDSARGSYQAYAAPAGSRLVYRIYADAGDAPSWLRTQLQTGTLRDQLDGIRKRAEAAAAAR